MNGEDRGKYILTKVLNMAHDDLVDDNRIVAIQVITSPFNQFTLFVTLQQLLTQMAHCFGTDLCE